MDNRIVPPPHGVVELCVAGTNLIDTPYLSEASKMSDIASSAPALLRNLWLSCLLLPAFEAYSAEFSLSPALKSLVIENVAQQLEEKYVFPDRAAVASNELQQRFNTGYFDEIDDPQIFANRIVGVLDVINDWHLWVNYYADPIPENYDYYTSLNEEDQRARLRRRNFGIERLERLTGNVGLIEFREFGYLESESETALVHAMELLSNTSGLIIDLRRNGGGSPDMVSMVASYFLEPGHHIGTIVYREDGRQEESYTRESLQGPHYGLDRPIRILIGEGTFSGAEAFAYALQARGRAELVGQRTIGGAHPTIQVRLHEHFMMGVPVARSIDAVTKSNWQYVGVRPDLEIMPSETLRQAQFSILRNLISGESDPTIRREFEFALEQLEN